MTFIVSMGFGSFTLALVGLLIGGIAAAPLGGYFAKRIPLRALLIMVGVLLIATSGYGIWKALA